MEQTNAEKNVELEVLRRPAIKSGMGNWAYYISTMSYKQLATYVKMPKEVCDAKELSDKIQRDLTDNVKNIVSYLKKEEDRFFNALVLAVFEGKPSWFPGMFEKDEQQFSNIGLLVFTGKEKIFPVDGQHRLAAIKELTKQDLLNSSEEVPVIFVSHQDSLAGNERTRRLFTSLNRYPRIIKESESIALDEDDIVAITTRYLVEKSDLFKGMVIDQKTESMNPSDSTHFTNIITLDKCNRFLLNSFLKDVEDVDIDEYRRYRQSEDTINAFEKFVEEFWENLVSINASVDKLFKEKTIPEMRGDKGGSLFFRPRGLSPYVEAVTEIYINEKDKSLKDIMLYFSTMNDDITSELWKSILWEGTILDPSRALMRDIFIYMYNPDFVSKRRRETVITKYCDKKHISREEGEAILLRKGITGEK